MKYCEDNFIDWMPSILSFDRRLSWSFNTTVALDTLIDTNNISNRLSPSDDRHPGEIGKMLMGNSIIRYLANKIKD